MEKLYLIFVLSPVIFVIVAVIVIELLRSRKLKNNGQIAREESDSWHKCKIIIDIDCVGEHAYLDIEILDGELHKGIEKSLADCRNIKEFILNNNLHIGDEFNCEVKYRIDESTWLINNDSIEFRDFNSIVRNNRKFKHYKLRIETIEAAELDINKNYSDIQDLFFISEDNTEKIFEAPNEGYTIVELQDLHDPEIKYISIVD